MTVVAILIFLATLTLVIWQPKGLGIGWSALGGAALALITTVVSLSDIPIVWDIVWNATFAFVAIVIISLILDESGFFTWAALHVARWGRGNGRLLFTLIVLLGAAIAAVFANDGAALILTPIVIQMLLALKFPARASLAFVIACGFIADAGSLPLVVSNLVNIVTADFFDISFARYAVVMVPVGLVSVAASLGVLLLFFRKAIPRHYDVTVLANPRSAIADPLTFKTGWVVLGVLLIGYFAADPLHIPLSAVAGLGAVVLMIVASRRPAFLFPRAAALAGAPDTRHAAPESAHAADRAEDLDYETAGVGRWTTVGPLASPASHAGPADDSEDLRASAGGTAAVRAQAGRISVPRILREAPWQIVLFSIGMYLVVYGLRNQGLTDELAGVFSAVGSNGVLITALGVGVIVAVLASLMNNMPTVLIASLAIGSAGATGLTQEAMIYANVIGSDLGPKITPIGSLATLLWLHVLDRKGIHIGWGQYFRTGIVLTIPVLLITLVALAGWLTVVGV
ncbi:arsenic transporter [Arthrobacter antioxidans]|uniref:arsenic transporter n=1 Tax=Arthrobacter antioxidans TaxID=2895818 RepID=UPI00200020F0|nr:arsenic transporter [Arthrobacter antioxidans]